MREKNIEIWKKKLDWIVENGGMVLFDTHPDYMNFRENILDNEEYPVEYYEQILNYIKEKYEGQYWHALPKDIARFWKNNFSSEGERRRKKINVCMLAYTFYEIDGRVRRYAETLAKRGDNVDVIALRKQGQSKHEVINGVNVCRIQERVFNEKGNLSHLYRLLKFLINSSLFLAKENLKNSYDIIHVHSVPDFEVFATLYPQLFGSKIILDIHDPVPDFFSAKFGYGKDSIYFKSLKLIEQCSSKYADHVITVTDYWRDVIKDRSHIPDDKITTIVNLPDIEMFNPERLEKKHRSDSDFIILYPGTFNKHCGVDIVIKAISLLKDEIPKIKFHIYGTGGELYNLKSLVKDLVLENSVVFHDPVPLQDIPRLMLESDIGIALLAGNDDYSKHALNVKLFEFLSMGLPAIATRTTSIKYYLGDKVAMLSNPNDPEDVARCIKELYYNPDKRAELRKRGLIYTEKNNWKKEEDIFIDIVNKLLSATG